MLVTVLVCVCFVCVLVCVCPCESVGCYVGSCEIVFQPFRAPRIHVPYQNILFWNFCSSLGGHVESKEETKRDSTVHISNSGVRILHYHTLIILL